MISNLEEIKSILEYENGNIFYFIQVLQRKKDNPEQSSETIKRYSKFVKDERGLIDAYDKSVLISDFYNARTYINLCPISAVKFSKKLLLELTRRLCNDYFIDNYAIADRIALDNSVFFKNFWIIDIDIPLIPENTEALIDIDHYLSSKEITRICELKTPNGKHIIVKSFNYMNAFSDIKKLEDNNFQLPNNLEFTLKLNSFTLLYSPDTIVSTNTVFKKVNGLYQKL